MTKLHRSLLQLCRCSAIDQVMGVQFSRSGRDVSKLGKDHT